ncbi:MAG: FtsX-like permease family protein [Oscillospiraceae bacterium]|nr:FtsX-like permease family protein [Oscillospiraceae bacterium]
MLIRPKDAAKLLGIVIMCACAVLVCTLFLNMNIDLAREKDKVTDAEIMVWYDAMVSSGRMTSAVTGGALGLTTVVMLFFYIKHYIDAHKSELGVLKAMGYSSFKIAKNFWIFGLSVLMGAAIGFALSFTLMPTLYEDVRSGGEMPGVTLHFNPVLVLFMVIMPALVFSLLAVLYGCRKLKRPPLELIRGKGNTKIRITGQAKAAGTAFLRDLRQSTVKSRFSLVFFIGLAAFCYAATVVMSFSIKEVGSSRMMAVMMAGIGVVLAVTTLLIAVTTIIKGNSKTIAMLRIFGYSDRECSGAILSGYRPVTYIGFALGTAYQHGLMLMMISLVYDGEVLVAPDYSFNIRAFFIALVSFVLLYELFMLVFAKRIRRIPLKEVMQEE